MKAFTRKIILGMGICAAILGGLFLSHAVDSILIRLFSAITHLAFQNTWPNRITQIGQGWILLSAFFLLTGLYLLSEHLWLNSTWRWLEVKLAVAIDWSKASLPGDYSWPQLKPVDWLICLPFLFYALLLFVGNIQGNFPQIMLGGDAQNTASFAAGFDHPNAFRGDMLLGDTRNFQIYSTFNVYFTRWITALTGSYSLSLLILLPIQTFVQLVGFYILGRILFSNRAWAVLLTLVLAFPVRLNLGEYWGMLPEPVARFQFQALLPFVLGMVLVWNNQPRRWPWIMAATGLLFYFHPVSTPAWASAIWLSLFLLAPAQWSFWKKLGYMTLMGLIFMAAAGPFIFNYLSNHVQGKSTNYNLVMMIIQRHMPENLINIPSALGKFLEITASSGLLWMAAIALALLLVLHTGSRRLLHMLWGWISGILLICLAVPWVMHRIEQILRLIPVETEMVRATRYLVMFMLILIFVALVLLGKAVRYRHAAALFWGLGALFTLYWGIVNPLPFDEIGQALSCLSQGKVVCVVPSTYELAIQAVREKTAPGSTIYVTFANQSALAYGMPIRFMALRPLVYAYKDRGLLIYSNDVVLRRWYDTFEKVNPLVTDTSSPYKLLRKHNQIAQELKAQYILTDIPLDPASAGINPNRIVFTNGDFTLFRTR